jgi:hypothetical protein
MGQHAGEGAEQFFDVTPYLRLVIDKDGRWFQNGAEIIHPEIYRYFCRSLEKTPEGGFQIRCDREVCRVEVEDAPFVVVRVRGDDRIGLSVELNDGTREPFLPEHFWISAGSVPYIEVKGGAFHARFSRPAYYQLAEYIVTDAEEQTFSFLLDGKRTPIRVLGE